MKLELLADNPDAVTQVATWYFHQWPSDHPNFSLARVIEKTATYTARDGAPLMVLAKCEGTVVGAAQLKIREMAIYPEYEYWLGGVYVAPAHRGQGIASALVGEVLQRARAAGVDKLYLQTEALGGGLYQKQGFVPLEEVDYKGYHVQVMVADLGA